MRKRMGRLRELAEEAGRDVATVGVECRMPIGRGDPLRWREEAEGWRGLGATHLSAITAGNGFSSVGEHAEALARFKEAMDYSVTNNR